LLSTGRQYPQKSFLLFEIDLIDSPLKIGGLSMKNSKIKVVKFRIPKYCVCPFCGLKQRFKKEKEHYKMVKDIDVDKELLLKIRIVYAKCLNPNCEKRSFRLPTPGIERYQKATERLIKESTASLVDDLSTTRRVAKRLTRVFNTTGSKSTVDRWKHKLADKFDIKDIISKLEFSGILCLDEFKAKSLRVFNLIATDALKNRILYIEPLELTYFKAGTPPRGSIESGLEKLKDLGINPWAVIIDLLATYPKQIRKVWPEVIIQYDHFHIMQVVYKYLKNAILSFRKNLKDRLLEDYKRELWEKKWLILSNMDTWSNLSHQQMQELMEVYQGTVIEDVLIFKEQIRLILQEANTKEEAYYLRDELFKQTFWKKSYHLTKIMSLLMSHKFDYMLTHLSYPNIPRAGNSETLIRTWRQMEKVRYGFKTLKGQLDHLKLFQVNTYLNGEI
jgi:transposase